eukprot:gene19931-25505_t
MYGWVMASACVAYFGGTFVCRALLARFGLQRTVAIAGALSAGGGTLMALVAWMGWHNPWALTLPFYLFMLAHGIHQPCGQSGAVGPFPKAAGVASALNGFMMMLAAFAIGGWLGMRLDGTVLCSILPDWQAGTWKNYLPGLGGKVKLMRLPAWEPGGRRTSVWGGT